MAAVAGSQLCLGDREGAGRGCGGACGRRKGRWQAGEEGRKRVRDASGYVS